MYRILITGRLHPLALELLEQAAEVHFDNRPDLPYGEVLECIGAYHALISRSETQVTAELLDRGTQLKVIARAAVGVGNIDVEHASSRGVLVINTPGVNTTSAAELAIGLLIAAARQIPRAHQAMRAGRWERHRFSGLELRGKTLGIIGLGNVGRQVAAIATGMGMKVLARDPYLPEAAFAARQATKTELRPLLEQCDAFTLHTPLNTETRGMLGTRELGWLKPGAIAINAARGGLIDEAAFLEALEQGRIGAAGIDTWSVEPPLENPFAALEQVVMTPHIGASTEEAQRRIARLVVEQTLRALHDEVVEHPVNLPRMPALTARAREYVVLAAKLGAFARQCLDFTPTKARAIYRGALSSQEAGLVRRAFLKAFLALAAAEAVTYVNAERVAAAHGLVLSEEDDPAFTDYTSAVKFELQGQPGETLVIGGVALGQGNHRLSLLDGFVFEMELEGWMLYVINADRPGVIGDIGHTLAHHGVNINQFQLSRNMPGGKAMSLIRLDTPAAHPVLQALRSIPNVQAVRAMQI